MLGILRLALALMVVLNHLWLPTANRIGSHAVAGFYMVSGYLMTRVRCEVYRGPGGVRRFFANRALRIYPQYWVVLLATACGLALWPHDFGSPNVAMRMPSIAAEWFSNLTLSGLVNAPLRLVPPAWSLAVECVFYGLIGLGISRHPLAAAAWWLASALYTVALVVTDAPFSMRYTPPAAASLFFASGALLYHLRRLVIPRRAALAWWLPLLVAFATLPLYADTLRLDPRGAGFYLAALLFVPLLAGSLADAPSRYSLLDARCGALAYPMFLTHYFAAGVVSTLAGAALPSHSGGHCATSVMLCVALSAALLRWFDPAIERLRDRVRPARVSPSHTHPDGYPPTASEAFAKTGRIAQEHGRAS